MNLAELQHYFASAATSGGGPLAGLDEVFVSDGLLSASERLAIYNRAYYYRLLDALSSVFGQTQRVIGSADFERVGLAYLARYPSEHPAVERIGRSFSEYLRTLAAPPLVVDLASLEWARLCALVAANPSRLATLSAIEPSSFPQARLRFVPALHALELDPSALSAFAGADLDLSTADPARPPCTVVIWRRQHTVLHEALDPLESRALARAMSGAMLCDVCTVFDSGSSAEDVRRAFQVLSTWFARDWLERVEHDEAARFAV